MKKILTLIIPTYNMEEYLDKCLTSLIIDDKELLKQVEVLVIIDGATDRSSEIAHGYEARYPDTFCVIDKENGNYGSCINRGLKEATGKYIKVLDADDWFDTAVFERYLRKLQEVDVDLVLNDVNLVDVNGRVTSKWHFPCEQDMVLDFEKFIDYVGCLQMHMVAFKTKNVRNIGYHQTEGISYTDQEWITWPMVTIDKFYSVKVDLYNYLLGRTGQTVDKCVAAKSFDDIETMIFSLGRIWRNYKGLQNKKRILYNKFSGQIYCKYKDFFTDKLYPEKQFRRFDEELLKLYPEIKNLTDILIYTHLRINFHIVPLWRNHLLWIYHVSLFISELKNNFVDIVNSAYNSCRKV